MQSLIILHTNDIHGRIAGLARVATLVEQIRAAHPQQPVLYLDAGDSEETSVRLSNLTKGAAMHRLLSAAGCDAAAIGNAAPLRYGQQVLVEHAAAARYPLLLANMRESDGTPVAGVQLTARMQIGDFQLGLIGVTAELDGDYERWFGLKLPPVPPLIRELAAQLRQDGAQAVLLLSHLGLAADRELAAVVQEDIAIIIGAHSHDLLPRGERIGRVLLAQAGKYAEHLGRLDLRWDGEQLLVEHIGVLPVNEDIPQSPGVLAEVAAIEDEVARFLDQPIGALAAPLDFATDRECGVANLAADVLRAHMHAEVGVIAAGQAFSAPLPGGTLRRLALWEACASSANPGVTSMTGAQLQALIARGQNPTFAAARPRTLRGQARGLLHISGAQLQSGQLLVHGQPIDPARSYRVAGSDWEFEQYGGYADPAWQLQTRYDMPTILREAIEAYLAERGPVIVHMDRLR